MSNKLPPGLEPETPSNSSLPPGLVKDVATKAAQNKARLEAEAAAEPKQAGAFQRFMQGMGVPTTKKEFLEELGWAAAGPVGMALRAPYGMVETVRQDPSMLGLNRAINPMVSPIEAFGEKDIAGGFGGTAANLIMGAAGLSAAPRVPVGKTPRAMKINVAPKKPSPPTQIQFKDSPPRTSPFGTPQAEPVSVFGKDIRSRRLTGYVIDDILSKIPLAGPWLGEQASKLITKPTHTEYKPLKRALYGEAKIDPIRPRNVSIDMDTPTFVKGSVHESVPNATEISPSIPVDMSTIDFGAKSPLLPSDFPPFLPPSGGPLPPPAPMAGSPPLRTGDWFQPTPEAAYGNAPAQTRTGRFVNPYPNDTAPLTFEPGNAGSAATQGMTPPLGPADIQGIKGQTQQMLESTNRLGPQSVAGFSPEQLQQPLQLISQIPDE